MIKKLQLELVDVQNGICIPPSSIEITEKINEIIDIVNQLDLKRSKSDVLVVETCPKCGNDLTDLVICTNPPIPQKKCLACGWEWTGERKEVIRIPFDEAQENLNIINSITDKTTEKEIISQLIAMVEATTLDENKLYNQSMEGCASFE